MPFPFVRKIAAFILIAVGLCLVLLSLPVAFGWGHKTLSVLGTLLAASGYIGMLAGHWFLRDSDWQVLASSCIKWLLLLGSMLLFIGMVAMVIHPVDEYFPIPYGYLIVVGCFSVVGYWQFRKFIES